MPKRKKQSKLTRAARDQSCTANIAPYCNDDPQTTVLAHAPHIDGGMGTKGPDEWALFACSDCHDIIDGRVTVELSEEEVFICVYRGIQRTQKHFKAMGLIEVRL